MEERLIPTPPVAAGPLKVTVPVDLFPPITDVGATDTPIKAGGVIVKAPVFETLPSEPVMVAVFVL